MFVCVGVLSYSTTAGAFLRCQLHKWRTQDLHYKTTYTFAAGETKTALKRYPSLPKRGVLAIARLFEVGSDVKQVKPCRNLSITKRLFLQRRDDTAFVFTEVNEFYAKDGTLITTNKQDVTNQLMRTGYYVAANLLPIPEHAPPGRYRLRSKLLLTRKGRKQTFLVASADTEYEILPSN
ncbi:MAG: hypothetical protein ACE5K1_02935 [Acidiferrobacterales bacterium]